MADNIKKPKTMEDFGEQIKEATLANKLIVVFFSANWSGKCEYMLNIIERELAVTHSDVVFILVDIDDMVALQFEWFVDSVPTFVLLKQEHIVEKILGPYPNELEYVIGKLKKRTVYNRQKVLNGFPNKILPFWNEKDPPGPELHLNR